MTEVSREGGRRWCRQESGLQILWKKERESLSLSEFKLATNKTLSVVQVGLLFVVQRRYSLAVRRNTAWRTPACPANITPRRGQTRT